MAELDLAEWSANAAEVIDIDLVTKPVGNRSSLNRLHTFHPAWTYPIVGDQETIVGYKDLKIYLEFNASDMRPFLRYSKTADIDTTISGFKAPDIKGLFQDFLPLSAFSTRKDFIDAVQATPDDWHPPGELVQTYKTDPTSYEVWKGNLADPLVLAMLKRIQILVSFFIEGGTPIATESTDEREADPLNRWTVFFLYHRITRKEMPGKFSYVFAGYSTVYRFYVFRPPPPPTGDFELPKESVPFDFFPCRSRISQFIILEPFQHKGNGQRLYSTIYQTLLHDANTFEITVEDPNELFDRLRDMADMHFLRKQPEFDAIKINTSVKIPSKGLLPNNIVDKEALEAIRQKCKMAPRQFSRLTEMHLMSKLPDSVRRDIKAEVERKAKKTASKEDEYVYRLWQLVVKSRINAQNKEQLAALEPDERITALQETLQSVEFEYCELLTVIAETAAKDPGKKRKLSEGAQVVDKTSTGKKRRLAKEDDDAENGRNEPMPDLGEPEPSKGFVEQMPDSPDIDMLSD